MFGHYLDASELKMFLFLNIPRVYLSLYLKIIDLIRLK
jgi:hypothetical protein